MRWLQERPSREERQRITALLESNGIPVYVADSPQGLAQGMYVCLDAQYNDAVALLHNPDHKVAVRVDVNDFYQQLEKAQRQSPLSVPVAISIVAALLTIVVVVIAFIISRAHGATMASLPANVREALVALCAPCEFADYDAPWNSTDLVLDGIPQRHLRRIEHMGASWLIEYDHGLHAHTVIFELEPTVHVGNDSSCDPAEKRCEW